MFFSIFFFQEHTFVFVPCLIACIQATFFLFFFQITEEEETISCASPKQEHMMSFLMLMYLCIFTSKEECCWGLSNAKTTND